VAAPELGIIEGFYGRPWTWQERERVVAALSPFGYRFYMYAPKADPYLRLKWRDDYPRDTADALKAFADSCRSSGTRFGIGISPVLPDGFDGDAQDALQRKLQLFDDIGVEDLGLLFDDMTGATDDMAQRQADVVHWAAARTRASRIIMCPSYYTDDPVLDRVFGARPPQYVETLGDLLDSTVDIFWTGEEVCSRAITAGHLERVTNTLRRKPFLWDNYPVNDGARMSQYLHVRGFTGRTAEIADSIKAHGVNPALQPTLTLVPCATLADAYGRGSAYEYQQSMRAAAVHLFGESIGSMLYEDTLFLQDVGLDRLGEKEAALRARYENVDHPAAREITAWLNGEYRITDALIRAMAGNEQG
jgi:hypothetical protein